MKTNLTIKDLEEKKRLGLIRDFKIMGEGKTEKKSKYGNKKVFFDGHHFDSQKECNRYVQLRMLERAGEIKELRLQVGYELNELGSHSLKYICDFVYILTKTGEAKFEDVKGFRTQVYKKKKKLMFKVYGITITEI